MTFNREPEGERVPGRRNRKRTSAATVSLAKKTAGREIVLAASGGENAGVTVDEKAGVIGNVAILTAGMAFPADGDPFEIDAVMLQQVADCINAARTGVKSRVSHPELAGGPHWPGGDSIFHLVGRCRNAKVVNNQVRGDMALGNYAANSPQGDMRAYLLGLATEDPSAIGISIRFLQGEYAQRDVLPPLGRCLSVLAVDFVGTPGGNPNGLLSGEAGAGENASGAEDGGTSKPGRQDGDITPTDKETPVKINARQRAYLSSCGLGKDADEKAVTELAGKLKPTEKAYFDSLAGEEKDEAKTQAAPKTADPAEQHLSADEAAKTAEKTLTADRERRTAILALAAGEKPAINLDTARQWADDGVSLADAKRLASLASKRPIPVGRIEGGDDRNVSTLSGGISDALLLRAGWGSAQRPLLTFDPITGLAERDVEGRFVARKPHERALTMRRMPVLEMARLWLTAIGVTGEHLASLGPEGMISLASGPRKPDLYARLREAGGSVELAMSTSDFPYILADALNKVFLGGYNLAPSTGDLWTRRMTARDFKDIKLLNLSEAPALTTRIEGAEIVFGTLSESREVVALIEYATGLRWTRRAQLNDDLGVLRDGGAMALGAMARYKEDDVRYAVLTANAAMSDTGLLFNVTAVTTTGGHANLSAGASTAIYAAAAPGLHPTVVTLFLESEQSPVLKQQTEWKTDDLEVAVRHSVAAKAADWRGLYKDVSGNCTVTSLAAIVEAMSTQKGPNGAFLNLRPAYILTPVGAKEVAFAQLVGSNVDPSKTNATPNPFFNRLTVVADPRLN